jgi:hypothetical protein
MTAADMNVGPAPPVVLETPRRAPGSRLARLLLHSAHKVVVLLLPLLLSLPACIIPVGPEFHDPLGVPNSAPYIVSTEPDQGGTYQTSRFEVHFRDPNVGDDLYLRWIIDFPPFRQGTTMILPTEPVAHHADGTALDESRSKTFLCASLTPLPTHQIMVVVADRDFDPSPGDPRRVVGNGLFAIANWTWNAQDCQR